MQKYIFKFIMKIYFKKIRKVDSKKKEALSLLKFFICSP